ncbi:hypothetical protein DPMN_147166 [Dreissena polymorpha]|uniref:Uncharacterized protein n=1 Tax=Dreissena polymorpha TaxID=45954 RepID=A0A9D4FBP7_DREPO|nr:hypothetical protein DPMN_147166 [Dreissena polymorpha]
MDSTIFQSLTGNVSGHIMTGPFTWQLSPVTDRSGSVTNYQSPGITLCFHRSHYVAPRVSSTLPSYIPLVMTPSNPILYGFNSLEDNLCLLIPMFYWRPLVSKSSTLT